MLVDTSGNLPGQRTPSALRSHSHFGLAKTNPRNSTCNYPLLRQHQPTWFPKWFLSSVSFSRLPIPLNKCFAWGLAWIFVWLVFFFFFSLFLIFYQEGEEGGNMLSFKPSLQHHVFLLSFKPTNLSWGPRAYWFTSQSPQFPK
jgi:hypothetical protein